MSNNRANSLRFHSNMKLKADLVAQVRDQQSTLTRRNSKTNMILRCLAHKLWYHRTSLIKECDQIVLTKLTSWEILLILGSQVSEVLLTLGFTRILLIRASRTVGRADLWACLWCLFFLSHQRLGSFSEWEIENTTHICTLCSCSLFASPTCEFYFIR